MHHKPGSILRTPSAAISQFCIYIPDACIPYVLTRTQWLRVNKQERGASRGCCMSAIARNCRVHDLGRRQVGWNDWENLNVLITLTMCDESARTQSRCNSRAVRHSLCVKGGTHAYQDCAVLASPNDIESAVHVRSKWTTTLLASSPGIRTSCTLDIGSRPARISRVKQRQTIVVTMQQSPTCGPRNPQSAYRGSGSNTGIKGVITG
jgi:hypothetical protein